MNGTEVYFDNSATTALCEAALGRMSEVMVRYYGNPSSLHTLGVDAERIVSQARAELLNALGVKGISPFGDPRLVFTASGTEADNLALFGVCRAKKFRPGQKIIVSDSEHPAVGRCADKLESDGFRVVRIPSIKGRFDYDMLEAEADSDTVLVSVMLVNNETGAVNDIKRISKIVKSKNREAVIHTDAVQGFLKLKFTPASLGADLITLSSHKIHGPKGVGALYIDSAIIKARKLVPIIYGGGQEKGFRSGTENTVGIAGFGAAAAYFSKQLDSGIEKMKSLRDYIENELAREFTLNIPDSERAPHIVSLRLPGIKSETMLHYLSGEGVYVSSGSACSSHSGHVSGTLLSFGLTEREADSTIRISLSEYNTFDEADILISKISQGVQKLAVSIK